MNTDSIIDFFRGISALKWVLMILLTGFIAQFGKMFAEFIIRKAARKKAHPDSFTSDVRSKASANTNRPETVIKKSKVEKKAEKAAAKRMKKGD